jgi:hypothetical protein
MLGGTVTKRKRKSSLPFADSIAAEMKVAGDRLAAQKSQSEKKNYAQRLSSALAQKVANGLRPHFDGIYPDSEGRRQESKALTAKGHKKLDVNYSTPELGLGLGVSIKTLNFPDAGSKRYTKNVTRIDNELRAEAHDYHQRQPFAVMAALVFLPYEACSDGGKNSPSSFGHAVKTFFYRARRALPTDDASLFEKIFVALYVADGDNRGATTFFDVQKRPPYHGPPSEMLTMTQVLEEIRQAFDTRNEATFKWAEGKVTTSNDTADDSGAEDEA